MKITAEARVPACPESVLSAEQGSPTLPESDFFPLRFVSGPVPEISINMESARSVAAHDRKHWTIKPRASSMAMTITTAGPQSIGQIAIYFEQGDLFLSPDEYQRENAWDIAQKQLLIDTVFRGLDIPKFYLWKIDDETLKSGYPNNDTKEYYRNLLDRKRKENDDPSPYVYEVVDGQQRIRTILEFMGKRPKNEKVYRGHWREPFASMVDTPMALGKAYSALNAEQKVKFDQRALTIMVLERATIDEIRDMFLRLQNGTPLNAQQKRDARKSTIGREAKELAELSFFKASVAFDNAMAEHHRVAAQMVLLELKGNVVSCSSRQLDKIYKQYENINVDEAVIQKVRRVIRLLGKIFPERVININRSYALGLFWLMSRVTETYVLPETEFPKVRANFIKLDVDRMEAHTRDYDGGDFDDVYQDLTISMSHGTDGGEGIATRQRILAQFLFEEVTLQALPTLDPKRAFSFEEKAILYHRSGGKCQLEHEGMLCGRTIDFEDAVVDHIIPHSQGGSTALANGRIAYNLCNIARGARDDFDPGTKCRLIAQPQEPGSRECDQEEPQTTQNGSHIGV